MLVRTTPQHPTMAALLHLRMTTTAHHQTPTPKVRDLTDRRKDSMGRRKDSMGHRRDNTDSRDTDRRSRACTTSKARRRRGATMTTRGEVGRRMGFAPVCWRRWLAVAAWTACSKPRFCSKRSVARAQVRQGYILSGWVALIFACWMGLGDRGMQRCNGFVY
jgi:hypothetical protein